MSFVFENEINVDTISEMTPSAGVTIGGVNLKSNLITSLNNVQNTKVNLNASSDPTATDDSSAGYSIGSTWINTTNDKAYMCLDATASSAIWSEINNQTEEKNTASNVGTSGIGLFKQKTLSDLEFKKINSGNGKVTITDDTGNSEIDLNLALSVQSVSSVSTTTTTSTSYVVINTMQFQPGIGSYLVIFTCSANIGDDNSRTGYFILGTATPGGSTIAHSERQIENVSTHNHKVDVVVTTVAYITMTNDTHYIRALMRVSNASATLTVYERSLFMIKISN